MMEESICRIKKISNYLYYLFILRSVGDYLQSNQPDLVLNSNSRLLVPHPGNYF